MRALRRWLRRQLDESTLALLRPLLPFCPPLLSPWGRYLALAAALWLFHWLLRLLFLLAALVLTPLQMALLLPRRPSLAAALWIYPQLCQRLYHRAIDPVEHFYQYFLGEVLWALTRLLDPAWGLVYLKPLLAPFHVQGEIFAGLFLGYLLGQWITDQLWGPREPGELLREVARLHRALQLALILTALPSALGALGESLGELQSTFPGLVALVPQMGHGAWLLSLWQLLALANLWLSQYPENSPPPSPARSWLSGKVDFGQVRLALFFSLLRVQNPHCIRLLLALGRLLLALGRGLLRLRNFWRARREILRPLLGALLPLLLPFLALHSDTAAALLRALEFLSAWLPALLRQLGLRPLPLAPRPFHRHPGDHPGAFSPFVLFFSTRSHEQPL